MRENDTEHKPPPPTPGRSTACTLQPCSSQIPPKRVKHLGADRPHHSCSQSALEEVHQSQQGHNKTTRLFSHEL